MSVITRILAFLAFVLAAMIVYQSFDETPRFQRPVPEGFTCINWQVHERMVPVAVTEDLLLKFRMKEQICLAMREGN